MRRILQSEAPIAFGSRGALNNQAAEPVDRRDPSSLC